MTGQSNIYLPVENSGRAENVKCLLGVCKLASPDQLTVCGIHRDQLRSSGAEIQLATGESRRAVDPVGVRDKHPLSVSLR